VNRVVYLKSAKSDRRNILNYIARSSGSIRVGQKFLKRMASYCDHLASLPFQIGKERPNLRSDLRSSVFENYIIYFRYNDGNFEIVNIIEGHIDMPGQFS